MRYLRVTCRLASLLFVGLSLLIVHHAQPIAAKAYDDLCSSQGMTFGQGLSVNFLGLTLIALAPPLFFARSNALILTNLMLGFFTISGAASLLHTAANTPYECFTQAGTYDDSTSGLYGFEMWFAVAAVLSYVFLVVDLTIWSVKKLMASQRVHSERKQSNSIF
jgi:uncharacterized membrane protein YhdT